MIACLCVLLGHSDQMPLLALYMTTGAPASHNLELDNQMIEQLDVCDDNISESFTKKTCPGWQRLENHF